MSGRYPHPQEEYTPDPFADARHPHFQEPPRPFESTTSLSQDFGGQGRQQYDDEEELEKQPLTGGNVAGGFYPPGCVEHHLTTVLSPSFYFF
jgi:chitin synthase